MITSHLSALKEKHADLDSKLRREENRPSPNEQVIHDLKKKKLALKDEISRETEAA